MIHRGLETLRNKNVLLLQGPVGPFFARLAQDLKPVCRNIHKVNFNGGDWLFYPRNCVNYRGSMAQWPQWLSEHIELWDIDVILLFGDCRPVHRPVSVMAEAHGIQVAVFEEGYVRPDYITLESNGVNGNSTLSREPEFYLNDHSPTPRTQPVRKTYWYMILWGFLYFTSAAFGQPWFHRYRHHRGIQITEALPWLRSAWRKMVYERKEKDLLRYFLHSFRQNYYLVPLQVYNDAQITQHASWDTVENFITYVIQSFAGNAPSDTILVFKHHPMDRGYRDYTRLIQSTAANFQLEDRIFYIHDQHLPTLLTNARGVVVINSTVGFSALLHGTPTITCGEAFYDLPGLTWQNSLTRFWKEGCQQRPDIKLFHKFRNYIINHTQLNGSFYKKLPKSHYVSGLNIRPSLVRSLSSGRPEQFGPGPAVYHDRG